MPILNFERVSVDRPTNPDRLEYIAEHTQRVMRIAYSRLFEIQRVPQLPSGIVKRELFDETNPRFVLRQTRRISEHTKAGSTYTLGWGDDELIGLAKTTPSGSRRRASLRPNYYLNDVAVVYEGLGFGSQILAEALRIIPQERAISLDAFERSERTNEWFEHLGFEASDPQPTGMPGFKIGDIVIPQIRMRAPSVMLVNKRIRIQPN